MCPATICPNCNQKTYHRGTCETSTCAYDPMSATLEIPAGLWEDGSSPTSQFPGMKVEVFTSPFTIIRFSHREPRPPYQLADLLNYTGHFFTHHQTDPLDPTLMFGFDLVKDKADALLDRIQADVLKTSKKP